MKIKANLVEKPVNFQMDDCQIEKAVELSHEDFCRLKTTPLADQPFVRENKGCMFHRDDIIHCLLALGQGSNDGVLVDAEKYDYARLAVYVPGMRDIVNAEMGRAAGGKAKPSPPAGGPTFALCHGIDRRRGTVLGPRAREPCWGAVAW